MARPRKRAYRRCATDLQREIGARGIATHVRTSRHVQVARSASLRIPRACAGSEPRAVRAVPAPLPATQTAAAPMCVVPLMLTWNCEPFVGDTVTLRRGTPPHRRQPRPSRTQPIPTRASQRRRAGGAGNSSGAAHQAWETGVQIQAHMHATQNHTRPIKGVTAMLFSQAGDSGRTSHFRWPRWARRTPSPER